MDATVTVFQQMEENGGAVIVINKFDVSPDEVDRFLAAWTADAAVRLKDYPASAVVSPHLFRKVAVPGICVD
jgi:hypothetical protein